MFIESKEGRQYTFSLEISSKEISEQTLSETLSFFDQTLHRQKDIQDVEYSSNFDIPARVFREGNSGLRAIVAYLKDEKKLSFSRIALILGRDQRTIWSAYSKIKSPQTKTVKNMPSENEPSINTSVFSERKYSILENAAMHLLKTYSVRETAQILGRNNMTIWTVKRRAEQKANRARGRAKK